MDNQQYNKHLIDFYASTYLHIFLTKQKSKELVHAETMKVWDSFSEKFNDVFALNYLNDLTLKFPAIHDKFIYFPEQYWLTLHGKKSIQKFTLNIVNSIGEKIQKSIEGNEKPDDEFYCEFFTNLFHLHEKNKDYFFNVLNKFYPVLISFENIKHKKINYTQLFIEQISKEAENSTSKEIAKSIYLFLKNTLPKTN